MIDAGTGIRKLGKELAEDEAARSDVHLLISHTHWDHIQGLPFFSPLYQRGNKLFVYARKRDDLHLQAVFASQTDDPYFPVPFAEAQADIAFRELVEGGEVRDLRREGLLRAAQPPVHRHRLPIDRDGASVVYVSDTAPFNDILFEDEFVERPPSPGAELPAKDRQKLAKMRDGVVRLCEGADLVIYDTKFTARRLPAHPALRPLAPERRGRDLPRGGGQAAGALPSRARAHRRGDRRHPGRRAGAGGARERSRPRGRRGLRGARLRNRQELTET